MKKVALFHTNTATLEMMKKLTMDIMPDVEVIHLLEDSMIKDVMKHQGVTPEISTRIAAYIHIAEMANCDIFMTACSSIGHAVEQCQFMTTMPLTRIDQAMIDEAIAIGGNITVLATVETTLNPTLDFIRQRAKEANKELTIQSNLMADAFVALLDGNAVKHDEIVKNGLQRALKESDVVILAQASMSRVLDTMPTPEIPVLTSPERAVKWLYQQLQAMDSK